MLLRRARQPSTGLVYTVLWARTDAGEPMAIWGRIVGSDFYICGANRLIGDQVAEFEKWEATRYD
ncbi:hypothetical protein IU474_21900 [Nocardia otitidiscaviarum]|nr:hypothetical protein [Nocardia otitidiscaviarum]